MFTVTNIFFLILNIFLVIFNIVVLVWKKEFKKEPPKVDKRERWLKRLNNTMESIGRFKG